MLADAIEDSHQSCRDDYECSCSELNECIKAAMSAGCFAGRLTGAGMGGYAVGLVHAQDYQEFLEKMKAWYKQKGITDEQKLNEVVFLTEPGQGAGIVRME